MQNQNKDLLFALWKRIGAHGDAERVYVDLVARYAEPHRAYHTLAHIKHCLYELKQAKHLAVDPDVIEVALWYHDAIYDTKALDNEERSAALALAVLPHTFGQKVANLILATKHVTASAGVDTQLFVDIDLSILGQPAEEFDVYERQIRKEYEWVPDEVFATRRSAILKSFFERPRIYSTSFFYNKYEKQARNNITRSRAQLQGV